ncbi:MAG: alanine--tRNA ligase [Candidatus Gracilibacteria bacterium]
MNITSNEIRKKFIEFFKEHGHSVIPSAPVVPDNDPTVLFTTAGMHPLVPFLLGERHPLGKKLVNYQKCVRTGDIDDVGDNSHLTFFEMLGNWSLGDYFKKESIKYSFELLTSSKYLGIDKNKLAVTVFAGDKDAPIDEESAIIWQEMGMPKSRISYMSKKDNWWGPAGLTGPCGPDTEIFYRVGKDALPPMGSNVETDEKNWMEIWNNVFMEYLKDENGKINLASMQNVDTGMGLERITAVLNGKITVYDTDIFSDIIEVIAQTLSKTYNEETKKSMRIIADHTRTSVIMISDGIVPSNVDQGYILRRLLRRAIREGNKLGNKGQFLTPIANKIISKFEDIYEGVKKNKQKIIDEIEREEKQFLNTLENGLKEFDKLLKGFEIAFERTGKKIDIISGEKAFKLYDTYGFPLEMTYELAKELGLKVDEEGFQEAFKRHQELSRVGAEQKFKGGLADNSELTTALHSATHMMLAGLRKYLGADVHQKGSNITAERLRFDFNYGERVSPEILKKVEDFVNEIITKNCEMILEEIKKSDAEQDPTIEGSFWEKYPEIVKVYTLKDSEGNVYTRELCGGPHITTTTGMGKFRIIKEESSSAGVRRIKAVLEI